MKQVAVVKWPTPKGPITRVLEVEGTMSLDTLAEIVTKITEKAKNVNVSLHPTTTLQDYYISLLPTLDELRD